jgi:hypothetical protein
MKETLEQYHIFVGYLLLFLSLTVWGLALWRKEYLKIASTKWIIYLLGGIAFIAFFEWLFIFIIKHRYISKENALTILNFLGTKTTSFVNPISYTIKFIFLGLFLRNVFKSPQKKHFFQYLTYALVLFELIQVIVFKSYKEYNSLSSTFKNIFILGGMSLFLYKLYRTDSRGFPLQKNPYLWFSLGFLLPALAEIFLEFIFTKLQKTDLLSFYKFYLVRNASQIIGFTLLIVGVWQAKYLRFLPKEY